MRAFRGLRTTPPRARYDAVVVGAGIGGLVCANLLKRQGLSVLLVEQHYMAGGYCSTFRRKGFTFDASTHFYPLLGNPETLTGRLLADLGVTTRWVRMDPVDTFHLPDGTRFAVPAEFEAYRVKLWAAFPREHEALERFFALVRKAYVYGLLTHFRGREPAGPAPFRDWTVREALDRHFQDPKLKLLLTADCPHWGSPPARTSFVFDSMLRLSYFLGNYYPVGGSQAFADDLARCFEERGGEILMSTRATRILVHGGRAGGVVLETTRGALRGVREVAADSVVSNADLLLTLESLLGPEHVPPEYLAGLRRLRRSFPCFLTHVGLQGVPAEALEQAQGYYWDGWNPDRVGLDALRFKIFAPTLYEPAMAPPGGQIVILQKVLELDQESVTDWAAHRDALQERLMGWLEDVLPGIAGHVVVKLSASARTAERFTLNSGGAMLGWEMSPDQLGPARGGLESPLPGLFFVGHWAQPGGGITPVMVSSQRVAEAVCRGHALGGTAVAR